MSDDPMSRAPEPSPRTTQRPRCLRCQASPTVQRIVQGRPGFEYWTLRCTKCGSVYDTQVHIEPMRSEPKAG
jgi:uncharacterized Zn finger protein